MIQVLGRRINPAQPLTHMHFQLMHCPAPFAFNLRTIVHNISHFQGDWWLNLISNRFSAEYKPNMYKTLHIDG